jgi:hypothetical protein
MPDIDAVEIKQQSHAIADATFYAAGEPVFGYRAMQSNDGDSLIVVSVDPVSRVTLTTIVVYDRR